ncbi:acyl-CoA desaturase [Rhodococcus sp. BP-349]|uniref:fatty acid desaturase family protein n=1 Tax=unclassified Rhodococcus (in: high G+C Gram-positive bacteria) TaxID=192944 RepID=UPI001C9A9098|nr:MULTISPECIES: acyl-CoA desaturase [unclassified Rhodococcus (in: high G+C Gram-positive bacteria)]MBY6540475.1 acyl-CoA desaturase [Rhodococcus sp. BP-363]MBY6545500.1 acyl-CoA desaturase [Rhodococcus sp. BP-369]MBY6564730.1 acyl-CoA desaturase [Rhodococcus sp. BP-370]MBY6578334.1 acyl-CoA desaturase [Rhodococcus sp. BP-364]MBY6587635.1 acyl-CoA desaturase [Rhodococcus sp. BP-358]
MFGLSLSFLPFIGSSSAPDATTSGVDVMDEPGTDGPVVLSYEAVEELGRKLDDLRARTVADLGQEDRDYIFKIIKAQRGLEVAGRGLMYFGFFPPAWIAAVSALSLSKILDNMEIGHNVMHGQYDWMREPGLNSKVFEWDTACPADQWRHSHNYMHHTYTNILDMDRDIGYGILRMDTAQKWNPYYLGNPIYAFLLMTFFEWGVMLHDLEAENVIQGKRKWHDVKPLLQGWWNKAGRQVVKDYVAFPALTGPLFVPTLVGNFTANIVRNLWAYSIIFCGHFPTGVQTFTVEETAQETRGQWYVRQMLGSANIEGSPLFHIMSGNLSHQIEHHLFPDLPAHRYPQIAPEVKALCEEYGLPYNTGGFFHQIGTVWGKIFRLALPDRFTGVDKVTGVIIEREKAAA